MIAGTDPRVCTGMDWASFLGPLLNDVAGMAVAAQASRESEQGTYPPLCHAARHLDMGPAAGRSRVASAVLWTTA